MGCEVVHHNEITPELKEGLVVFDVLLVEDGLEGLGGEQVHEVVSDGGVLADREH